MMARITTTLFFPLAFFLLSCVAVLAQSQTTGRIAGTVKDERGAVVVGAEVTVSSKATGDERRVTTDTQGYYSVAALPPGAYRVRVAARGFAAMVFDAEVTITETREVETELKLAGVEPVVVTIESLIQRNGPQLGRVVDSRRF
jgi:hypothetical protein